MVQSTLYPLITPQDQDAKRLPFNQAEFGGIGLETLLALTLNLVKNKEISLPKALSLLTFNPSNILKLNLGTIEKIKMLIYVFLISQNHGKLVQTNL